MKIYTKTGDLGETSLYGGKRIEKSNIRIDAYGSVDELNSFIGLLRDQEILEEDRKDLTDIQYQLFNIGSLLATPSEDAEKLKLPKIKSKYINWLENKIDELNEELPPMKHFILPGGHTTVSYCHVCRTICRRVERLVVKLNMLTALDPNILIFLNRLSDYLFVLARKLTSQLNVEEIKWISEKQ